MSSTSYRTEIEIPEDRFLCLHLPAHVPVGRATAIAFSGAGGAWNVTGHGAASRRVVASQPMTEDQAGQILVLLGGGRINVGTRSLGVPELRIPNGGAPGRDWFACVRRQLFP